MNSTTGEYCSVGLSLFWSHSLGFYTVIRPVAEGGAGGELKPSPPHLDNFTRMAALNSRFSKLHRDSSSLTSFQAKILRTGSKFTMQKETFVVGCLRPSSCEITHSSKSVMNVQNWWSLMICLVLNDLPVVFVVSPSTLLPSTTLGEGVGSLG